ncbi:hypothetical protein [Bradyrhizobium sp. Ce-3]|uniref:hypothetical protein n=1 Tax=Bradyrhizobium sp. Ce-3 TaxID=2913970 RepID=UPI001FBB46CC|nr:hypothetical protein [Bradyrhizobium sp. Ce-3]GKQ50465.1 hypothetical protein BRSPCE3_13200 [Bradyrhizobium sp. Ce-3]
MSSGTCSRALVGWLAACAAATVVMSAFGIMVIAVEMSRDPNSTLPLGDSPIILLLALIDFIHVCVFTAIPSAFVIWLSRKYQIRSAVFFGCAGAAIGAVCIGVLDRFLAVTIPGRGGLFGQLATVWTSGFGGLCVAAGLAAGLTYWLVAGKQLAAVHPV